MYMPLILSQSLCIGRSQVSLYMDIPMLIQVILARCRQSTTCNAQVRLMLDATHNLLVTMCAYAQCMTSRWSVTHTNVDSVTACQDQTSVVAVHEPLPVIGVGTTNCNADTHKTQGAIDNVLDHNVRYTWSVIMLHALYYSLSLLRSSNVSLVETNIE